MRRVLQLLLAAAWFAGSAMGQLQWGTSWLSSHGTDSLTCGSVNNPCQNLNWSLGATVTGGLIKVLDGSPYSPGGQTITRPVTIDGSGVAVLEAIPGANVPVLTIKADCTLRNLIIQVTIGDGIQIAASGVHVHLENVTIQGVPGAFDNGVLVNSQGNFLTLNNVTITGATNGINLEVPTTFSGDHLHITRYTGIGVETQGGSATLRDSVIAGPGPGTNSFGIYATGFGSVTGTFLAERSEVSGNGIGVEADNSDGPGVFRISDMVITGNGTGLFPANGGQIISFRTNMIAGNGTDGTPSLGTSLK